MYGWRPEQSSSRWTAKGLADPVQAFDATEFEIRDRPDDPDTMARLRYVERESRSRTPHPQVRRRPSGRVAATGRSPRNVRSTRRMTRSTSLSDIGSPEGPLVVGLIPARSIQIVSRKVMPDLYLDRSASVEERTGGRAQGQAIIAEIEQAPGGPLRTN